jgi:pyruvate/2-oxoglutarate dehydrogenase complex dihydrolipoamide dehydrogenase (E3) component
MERFDIVIIGAGASGTEVASAFGRLGTQVTLVEALDQILPLEDEEISKACAREVKKQNVRIETGAKVESASPSDSGVSVTFNGETEEFDYLVIAAGRAPDVEGLGLEEAGIERDDRRLRRRNRDRVLHPGSVLGDACGGRRTAGRMRGWHRPLRGPPRFQRTHRGRAYGGHLLRCVR